MTTTVARHPGADQIVSRLKKWSKNNNLLTAEGQLVEALDTDYILHSLNIGKDTIQRLVAQVYSAVFNAFEKVTITSAAESYDIPRTAINERRVIGLWYAESDSPEKYRRLKPMPLEHYVYAEANPPSHYVIVGQTVMLYPTPNTGFLKFQIQRKDDNLDVRRGTVKAVQRSLDLQHLTAIELKNDDVLTQINRDAFESAEYVCVSRYDGLVNYYNAPVVSWDDTSAIITIREADALYTSGISEDDYVTIGLYTTTHSKLPGVFYQYYLEWARHAILRFDSSEEGIADLPMMQAIQSSILDSYSDNDDELPIPLEGSVGGEWPVVD